jgi:predicted DNA-binding transcriptional regulator AlpA
MQAIRRVMRTPQAAHYVGLSPSTLEKFRLRGNGPSYQKAGPKIVVYRLEDLDAWLEANRRRSTSDAGSNSAAGARADRIKAHKCARTGFHSDPQP